MNTTLIFNMLDFIKNHEVQELIRIIGWLDNRFCFDKELRPTVVVRRGLSDPFKGRVTEVSYMNEELVITLVDESGLILTEVTPDEFLPGEMSRITNLMSNHVCFNSVSNTQRIAVYIASRIDWTDMDDEKREVWRKKVSSWTDVFMNRFKDHVWKDEEDYQQHLDRYVTACLAGCK